MKCLRCDYEWYLRADIERGTGKYGVNRGSILSVEMVEPLNCPNSKCKSPYWTTVKGSGGKIVKA